MTKMISIHAPLRERPLAGARTARPPIISIHAPLRERPERRLKKMTINADFNPRSLTGATPRQPCLSATRHTFQSTLPYGSDPAPKTVYCPPVTFQSTLPYGSDPHQNKILLHSFKSSIYCEQAQFKSAKILF